MRNCGHRGLSSSNRAGARGLSLIELLVTLVIVSILAAAALPYAEATVRREKELELRRALRDIRSAIDQFHDDWQAGRMAKSTDGASDDGYPHTLRVLVEGVDKGDAKGGKRRYLRRIPHDPLAADPKLDPELQWVLRGYQDETDAIVWGRKDVYDLKSGSEATALDGTRYRDW
ncbi:MAG: type II secretion system protein [Thiobacillus sp.]|jgi:general secretion pathway protein G|uniref:type II secretion system protein n=1 Tax=Thiobacillus sp. TaxID=924 RepID=UPI0028947019|nr:type II secretion system protein [Thiobacillus sp.]MDT3706335.1 type II secretion system protein [Thiobacillus sp.]